MSEGLNLKLIRRDGGTQPRLGLNIETVAEYKESMTNGSGAKFPDVIVFHDGQVYWLADGYHRVEAALQAGREYINADIRQGQRRDAVLFSVGANSDHGLRRNNADKRRAVETLLRDDEWVKWSDREIARRCAVSDKTVAAVRSELYPPSAEIPQIERTVERNGSTYTMNVGKRESSVCPFAKGDEIYITYADWNNTPAAVLSIHEPQHSIQVRYPADHKTWGGKLIDSWLNWDMCSKTPKPEKLVALELKIGYFVSVGEDVGLICDVNNPQYTGKVCVKRDNAVGFMTHWIVIERVVYPCTQPEKVVQKTRVWQWGNSLRCAYDLSSNLVRTNLNVRGWFSRTMLGGIAYEVIQAGVIESQLGGAENEKFRITKTGCEWLGLPEIVYPPAAVELKLGDWVITRTGRVGQIVADLGGKDVDVKDDYSTRRHDRATLTKTHSPLDTWIPRKHQILRAIWQKHKDGDEWVNYDHLKTIETERTRLLSEGSVKANADTSRLWRITPDGCFAIGESMPRLSGSPIEQPAVAPPVIEVADGDDQDDDDIDENAQDLSDFVNGVTSFFESEVNMEVIPALYRVMHYADVGSGVDRQIIDDLDAVKKWFYSVMKMALDEHDEQKATV